MEIPKELNDTIRSHLTDEELAEIEALTQEQILKRQCERMNRRLEPVYDSAEYDCPKCHNAGVYYKIIKENIVAIICECINKREKKK